MTGFAKGPYRVKRAKAPSDGEYDYAIGADIGGTIYAIAEVFGRVGDDVRPDAKATAHLIAAAPDMYEALKAVQDYIADDDESSADNVADMIDAALAKAEGKE